MKAGVGHPPLSLIVCWLAGLAQGEEAEWMHWHMEDDSCRRCNLLARSPILNELATSLRLSRHL
jgi:hypothetical protein